MFQQSTFAIFIKTFTIMDEDLSLGNDNDESMSVKDEPCDLEVDEELKNTLISLQQHWMTEYMSNRDRTLAAVAKKMHEEFLSDQKKIREEMRAQFNEEVAVTRKNLEKEYMKMYKKEIEECAERHRNEIAAAKKTQWCARCEKQSIFLCCWNTSYCSEECQHQDWKSHKKHCRHPRIVASNIAKRNLELCQPDPQSSITVEKDAPEEKPSPEDTVQDRKDVQRAVHGQVQRLNVSKEEPQDDLQCLHPRVSKNGESADAVDMNDSAVQQMEPDALIQVDMDVKDTVEEIMRNF
uniref:MYND-type domain-containing protein n=1 Tax=Panagrolaimus sp. PS1159 TaxID=55785 RepID=A0AC35GH54_9BILA